MGVCLSRLALDIDFLKIVLCDNILIEADYAGNAFTQCFGIYGPFISEPAGCGFQSHAEFVQSGIVVRSVGRLKSILEAVGSDTAGVVFNNEASGLPQ